MDDEFRCKIQLPPPMPLLLTSASNLPAAVLSSGSKDSNNPSTPMKQQQQFLTGDDDGHQLHLGSASSSSSSPGARASSSDINEDSICSGSYVASSSKLGNGPNFRADSGVNSSDDSMSRASHGDEQQASTPLSGQQPPSASSSTHRLALLGGATTPQTATPPPLMIVDMPSPSTTKPSSLSAAKPQQQQSNVRPVSPALSHVSFANEPKFHILTDINTTSPASSAGPINCLRTGNGEDILSAPGGSVLLPHFSNTLQRYGRSGVFTAPRCVRASTPTTTRKAIPLLLSTSHHHFPPPLSASSSYAASSTLPRHHVVRIAEDDEEPPSRGHHGDQRSSTDDSSSSDDEDARIFSGVRRGRSAMRNNLRKLIANHQLQQQQKQQPSYCQFVQQQQQHQQQLRRHQPGSTLSTIPEQVETRPAGTSPLPSILSFVYAILLGSLSLAFILVDDQDDSSSSSPLIGASQGFSHFLLAGSLIVAAVVSYKRFSSSSSSGHQRRQRRRHGRVVEGVNKIRHQQQYDVIDAENGRITVLLSSPSVSCSSSSSSSSNASTPDAESRHFGNRVIEGLRRFERSALTVVCIGSFVAYGGGFIEALNQVAAFYGGEADDAVFAKNASNNSLAGCDESAAKHQATSSAVLNFWQFLLTPILGYLLFNDAKISLLGTGAGSSAVVGVGVAHLISTQFHCLISGNQFHAIYPTNCSALMARSILSVGDDRTGAMSILKEVVGDLRPFGTHVTLLFSVFVVAFLLHFFAKSGGKKDSSSSASSNGRSVGRGANRVFNGNETMVHFISATSGKYSWGRLCAITIGSLLTTVAVVWNVAILVASFSAKINSKKGRFVVLVGSAVDALSSPSSTSNSVGTFLAMAGDGVSVGILVVSLTVTIACAIIAYFQVADESTISVAPQPRLPQSSSMTFFSKFLLASSSAVLLLHFLDLLNWTATFQHTSSPVNVWLCYSQLLHTFVQTVVLVMCSSTSFYPLPSSSPLVSSSLFQRNIRPLFLLNSFANISLFLTAALKTFGGSTSSTSLAPALLPATVPHLLSVVQALNSAHYLVAAFILLRLAS